MLEVKPASECGPTTTWSGWYWLK